MKHSSRIILEKKIGETPLMAIRSFAATHTEYANVPLSYAGRLDPMASGKLLVLIGDECKKQKEYAKLDKEYEIEVLLDAGSDTGDALGIIESVAKETRLDDAGLKIFIQAERGAHMRAYPAFSSKPVDGKPLFLRALEGTLPDDMPEHTEEIYRITHIGTKRITTDELRTRINNFLANVPISDEPSKALGGDFRITDVRASWDTFFATAGARDFIIVSLRVTCGSGAYMRSLAGRLGAALGTKGLALSIHRTKIGRMLFRHLFIQI